MDIVRACPAIQLAVTAALDLVEQLQKEEEEKNPTHENGGKKLELVKKKKLHLIW